MGRIGVGVPGLSPAGDGSDEISLTSTCAGWDTNRVEHGAGDVGEVLQVEPEVSTPGDRLAP